MRMNYESIKRRHSSRICWQVTTNQIPFGGSAALCGQQLPWRPLWRVEVTNLTLASPVLWRSGNSKTKGRKLSGLLN